MEGSFKTDAEGLAWMDLLGQAATGGGGGERVAAA